MEQKLIKAAFWGMALSSLALPVVVMGASTIPTTQLTIGQLYVKLVLLMNYIFAAALALAVIMMVWGGVTYMTAGGDDEKIKTAKKRLIWGIVGAAIIIGAWAAITILAKFLGIDTSGLTPSGT